MNAEQIGLWAGLILSLMVFSYLLGDNALYRIAVYIFSGLVAGFVTVVTVESVVIPWLNATVIGTDVPLGARVLGAIPLALGLLLLLKGSPRLGRIGNLALAFIAGVGAAVAVAGAISGTLLPLASATSGAVSADPLNGFLVVLGVVCTLIYFQYLARPAPGGVRRGLPARVFGA